MAEGIKISEMEMTSSLQDGCCFPIVSEGENKRITKQNLFEQFKQEMVNLIYPIGAIYLTLAETNPATLFGGTWEKITNRFLVGAGDKYNKGKTGGSTTYTIADSILETVYNGEGFPTIIKGATSQNLTIIPPYTAVYIWKRTA